MRLKVQTELANVAGGLIGMGLERMKWPRPVYPGDTLRIVITITGKRLSASRKDRGVVNYEVKTYNQKNEVVLEGATAVLIPHRAA